MIYSNSMLQFPFCIVVRCVETYSRHVVTPCVHGEIGNYNMAVYRIMMKNTDSITSKSHFLNNFLHSNHLCVLGGMVMLLNRILGSQNCIYKFVPYLKVLINPWERFITFHILSHFIGLLVQILRLALSTLISFFCLKS